MRTSTIHLENKLLISTIYCICNLSKKWYLLKSNFVVLLKWCWCQVRCTIYSCSFEDPLETVYIILRSILCLSNIVLWQVSLFLFRSYCNPLHFFWIGMGKYILLLVRQGLGKSCKNQAISKIDEWDGCWYSNEVFYPGFSGVWSLSDPRMEKENHFKLF